MDHYHPTCPAAAKAKRPSIVTEPTDDLCSWCSRCDPNQPPELPLGLDPQPIIGQLQLFGAERFAASYEIMSDNDSLWQQLADLYSKRFGTEKDSAMRALYRMRAGAPISMRIADRWATLVGVHIDSLYPEEASA